MTHLSIRALLLASLMTTACATAGPRQDYNVQRDLSFPNHTYDEVWDALVKVFHDEGWPTETVAKDSGLISTPWGGLNRKPGWVDCGPGSNFAIDRNKTGRFSVLVRETAATITVNISTDFRIYREGIFQSYSEDQCVSTGMLEQRIKVLVTSNLMG